MKKTAIALAIALGTLSGGSASALTINQLTTLYPSNFLLEDTYFEYQSEDTNSNGLLDVGDRLKGVTEIGTFFDINGNDYSLDGSSNSHLSGIFEAEVSGIKDNDATPDDLTDDVDGLFNFTFAPVGGIPGVMITLYEDKTVADGGNGDNVAIFNCGGGNLGTCLSSVTDGTKILELGMTGTDLDEYWSSLDTPLSPDLTGQLTSAEFGEFNFGLSVLFSTIGQYADSTPVEPTSPTFGDGFGNDATQWGGSGAVKGACRNITAGVCTQAVPLADATGDVDLSASRIPEPATLGLLGLGLLGMAGLRRRKNA